jgi:hypothetical protein
MHDLIRRLAAWLRLLLASGTGKRRAGAPSATRRPSPPHSIALPHLTHPPLPLHRSPYGLHLPLDGTECRLVRPYLTAHVQKRARWHRSASELAASIGTDLDRHLIGADEVAV